MTIPMNQVITMRTVAYALSGLGGSNAHAAGFLAAAGDLAKQAPASEQPTPAVHRAHPSFISCTSGTIYWVAKYLEGEDLRQLVRDQADAARRATMMPGNQWGRTFEGLALVSLTGRPGVFEPAASTYVRHWAERFCDFLTPGGPHWLAVPTSLDDLWNLVYPAKVLTPTLDQATISSIAGTLKSAGIGIAFNAYEPESGIEYVHVNPQGLKMIGETIPEVEYGLRLDNRVYEPITPQAVRDSLWLLEYGFDRSADGRRLIDGEYARSIIIDELAFAGEIICVRSLNTRWLGQLPQNVFERLDLQTELWFNASYREQRDTIELINKLLKGWRGHRLKKVMTDPQAAGDGKAEADTQEDQIPDQDLPKKYHQVTLTPVEIQSQRGYFDYFVESLDVFDQAYSQSLTALRNTVPADRRTPGEPSGQSRSQIHERLHETSP